MAEKLQTISELHHFISGLLSRMWSHEEAETLAGSIIREYTGLDRARQLAYGSRETEIVTSDKIVLAARRVSTGEPLQYVFGYTEFCGHRIEVEPGVLIPRPETEEMTSLIIKENPGFHGTAADLCTGSGCIAIALSLAFPDATVYAADNSEQALKVAARNISVTGAAVKLLKADVLKQQAGTVPASNIIVSNPPYVTEREKKAMHINVLHHEPPEALFVPDADPLVYYRNLVAISDAALALHGCIWLEVNELYADETARLFRRDIYIDIRVIEDIRGKPRFVKAEKHG